MRGRPLSADLSAPASPSAWDDGDIQYEHGGGGDAQYEHAYAGVLGRRWKAV